MIIYARLIAVITLAICAVGCSSQPERPCNGTISVEAVVAATPAIDAFRAHLASSSVAGDTDKFLTDYRHYTLSITTTESQYIFEFVPRDEGRGFKGGGARYSVSKGNGKIEETLYMK